MGLRTVLVATDFSPLGKAALNHAASLARSNKAKLLLVHVVDPKPLLEGRKKLSPELQEALGTVTSQAQANLDAIDLGDILDIQRLVLIGNPADQIVALAAQDDVEVVIIGTAAASRQMDGSLGSTAQEVLNRARCRVVTLTKSEVTGGQNAG